MRTHAAAITLLGACLLAGCQSRQNSAAITTSGPSLQAARDALNEGEAGTSLAIAKGILGTHPNDVTALDQAGDAQAALGDRIAANISYKRALAISPHDVRARLGQGKLLVRDNLPAAEAAFRAVVAEAPHDPIALNDLGYVLDLQERHADAQTEYEASLAVDPDRLSTRVNLALSLALSGQGARAEALLRDVAASSNATPRMRADFALAQIMAGHDKDAAMTLESDLSPPEAEIAMRGLEQFRPVVAAK